MHTKDILGKRTALFGMTRTGKSNTVKILVDATEQLSSKVSNTSVVDQNIQNSLETFNKEGVPKDKVGQIIFDINGEYANKNLQDKISIFEKYKDKTTRYSVLEKDGFEVMKINFYKELHAGLELIRGYFKQFGKQPDYVEDFLGVNLEQSDDISKSTRYWRKITAYKCCLYAAGFPINSGYTVKFKGNPKELDHLVKHEGKIVDTNQRLTLPQATTWFTQIWKNYEEWPYLNDYDKENGRPWADNDLKALLRFLTQYRKPGEKGSVNSFIKLKPIVKYHSFKASILFEDQIDKLLRSGNIVIVDLSQGDPEIQKLYSEKICTKIFYNSMRRFIKPEVGKNNFIQFYFEEAHNLFPQKDDKDLSQIYNRIAKEGAKLNLGMLYATQEVSSISSNILKNTQNWFIAHLNNEDEIKELRKFYDFNDFSDALRRFSPKNDKGFVRMKTYSNPFVVPVQIAEFKK